MSTVPLCGQKTSAAQAWLFSPGGFAARLLFSPLLSISICVVICDPWRAWRSERNFTHTHFELRVTFWTSIYGLSYGNPISATKHSQAPCCPAPIPCYILAGVRHRRTFATYFGALRRIWTLFAYFGIFCVTFISDWIEQIQIYVIKLVSKMVTSDLSARINDVLRYVGITRNMNAYIILSQALTLIAEDENRL